MSNDYTIPIKLAVTEVNTQIEIDDSKIMVKKNLERLESLIHPKNE